MSRVLCIVLYYIFLSRNTNCIYPKVREYNTGLFYLFLSNKMENVPFIPKGTFSIFIHLIIDLLAIIRQLLHKH